MRALSLSLALLILITVGWNVSAAPDDTDNSADSAKLMQQAIALRDRLELAAAALEPAPDAAVGPDGLECRIGLELLRAAEALRDDYVAGLTEPGLIGYFNAPGNSAKFDAYWEQISKDWFDKRMPPCRDFANWEQFREDRLWVKCAAEVLDDAMARDSLGPDGYVVFGPDWSSLKSLREGEALPVPASPRRIDGAALEPLKHLIPGLFNKHRLDSSKDTIEKLRLAVHKETDDRLVHHRTGLRKKIFREYHADALARLDSLTADPDALIRLVMLRVSPDTLPGFDAADLIVLSPTPTGSSLTVESSSHAVAIGEVTLDRGAKVGRTRCWSFQLLPDEQNSLRLYLDHGKVGKLLMAGFGLTDPAAQAKALRESAASLAENVREPLENMLDEIDEITTRIGLKD
jgi:hypothetical protein